ncbi:MAG: winged helix DNA-binding domain-containing protein [Devosia sp.]
MPLQRLSNRQLNRATLARQMLLERSAMRPAEAAAFLGGLQAQQSNDPYIALWSRLDGFTHEALTRLIVDRVLVRATSMRGTLHLHTADDLIGFRALVQSFLEAGWKSNFLKRFGNEDKAKVRKAGVKLLDKGPMTAGALGKALKEKFPSAEALALAVMLQMSETLIQIPPTRIWGNGNAPLLTRIENWLPPPYKRPLSRIDLVRRYLRAFGPASINDMQIWCRLTKLGSEFDALGDELVRFEDADGRVLYDFPDAPRPDPDIPAPVRFLPLYDNVYLGYDNRRRMLVDADLKRINLFADFKPAVLVDGVIAAGWVVSVKKNAALLEIEPYHRLSKAQVREVETEGLAFLRFMQERADSFDVRVAAFSP